MPTNGSFGEHAANHESRRRAILLTCYMTGANKGQNLGVAGYSYDIVAELFLPLLARLGEVIPVAEPQRNLERAVAGARSQGLDPIHVSFLPFQDTHLTPSAPNVVVPAWEYPDVPNEGFGKNPQNDWPTMANQCALVIVGGPFTANALQRAGTTTPVHVVPVPTPADYFNLPLASRSRPTQLDVPAYVFSGQSRAAVLPLSVPLDMADRSARGHQTRPTPRKRLKSVGRAIRGATRSAIESVTPAGSYDRVSETLRAARTQWRQKPKPVWVPNYTKESFPELAGIVYTSIFSPHDGRKNWTDLLTGFLVGLGPYEDATLVLKLIGSQPQAANQVLSYYHGRDIPHRCKLVIVDDYLANERMLQITAASTYYVQTTRAEGNCLPLMNYLAAGRPAISPSHSAIADYFDERSGFVVESHPEPAAWPHEPPPLRFRTTWARIVWLSLVAQLRASYAMAKHDPAGYEALAMRCRTKMRDWASYQAVWPRLREAIEAASAAMSPTNARQRISA